MSEQDWERGLVEKIALEGLKEQRRNRRWGIFFKLLLASYVAAIFILPQVWSAHISRDKEPESHVAVVDITGPIVTRGPTSANRLVRNLEGAFEADNVDAVMLRINSPGGSPVQSGIVHDELKRLRAEHPDIPVYAVGTDLMASGAYYIASAADYIYADRASMVGSIGVVMNGFGFSDFIRELGIERRVYTAGENKAFLDPFSDEDPEVLAHIQVMLDEIHNQFIEVVKAGRGDRIDPENGEIFSGLIWTGSQSIDLGLVDGLGGPQYVAREVIGNDNMLLYADRSGLGLLQNLLRAGAEVFTDVAIERLGAEAITIK